MITGNKKSEVRKKIKEIKNKERQKISRMNWNDVVKGYDKCPNCKKTLFYNIHGINNRTNGKCQTPGCFAWME